MSNTSKILLVTIIATSILLGLGYAAIQNITLSIEGTATAAADQSNFLVKFTGTPTVSELTKVSANIETNTKATINVTGLNQSGQTATATYEIINQSSDLSADLAVATTNSNTEYFTLTSELADTSLTSGESTTVTVTVILTKTPIDGPVSSTIGVNLTAAPVQPGEEGSSGITNGSSTTPSTEIKTFQNLTKADAGKYVDLGNSFINTESTADDWRLAVIGPDASVLVLDDCLPVTAIPENDILEIDANTYPYGVWSNDTVNNLITNFYEYTDWSFLANGVNHIQVVATPSLLYLKDTYNYLAGTNYTTTNLTLNKDELGEYSELCFPSIASKSGNLGYWIQTQTSTGDQLYYVDCVDDTLSSATPDTKNIGIRPCIFLPSTTQYIETNGVITIVK